MKIFETGSKVNFVDDNNVFLGYDMDQYCCEHAGYFVSDKEENKEPESKGSEFDNYDGYNFNKEYFKEIKSQDMFDEGGIAIFKLEKENNPDLFVHIFNSHNGYYGHGFIFGVGKAPITYKEEDNANAIKKGIL